MGLTPILVFCLYPERPSSFAANLLVFAEVLL
jgi:hypothetical protein